MQTLLQLLTLWLLRCLVRLRYRVRVKGLENLTSKNLPHSGGILFLPNHPTIFVDPMLVTLPIHRKFKPRPLITEYMYFTPGVHGLMKWIRALPVPGLDLAPNSLKKARNEATFRETEEGLKRGENFLIYPSGRTKSSGLEVIGGASGIHRLLEESPEANVVLVRITGLWGSVFSRAITGVAPPFWPTVKTVAKAVLKNLIFFMPRREVTVEYVPAPKDFPRKASRRELNKWLEDWYNAPFPKKATKEHPAGEPLIQVPFSFWNRNDVPEIWNGGDEDRHPVSMEKVPEEIKGKVLGQLARMTKRSPEEITPEMDLATDLGLDSLDGADLIAFLEDELGCGRVQPLDLTTVKRVLGIASGQVKAKVQEADPAEIDLRVWKQSTPGRARITDGRLVPEVFLRACDEYKNRPACIDAKAGVLTYKDLKLRALILAEKIRYLPGQYVGIMLPASTAAYVTILATQIAGKIPVMVNWTVGRRHLETVVDVSGIEVVLTAWAFIDRLDNVDLTPIHDQIFFLEEIRSQISIFDKLQAVRRARKTPEALMRLFGLDKVKDLDPAVILFTSGTEKAPKGVPLSHHNILENQRATLEHVHFKTDVIVFAMLPPFHSFGFTLTGLLPLLCGIRSAYSPDPMDSYRTAREAKAWGVTLGCGAPSFLKGFLKACKDVGVSTIDMVWSGAERAPPDLEDLAHALGPDVKFLEGYGVTECSPVITVQRPESDDVFVGTAIPGVELKIVHPDTHEDLGTETRGLVLCRGPNVFQGYLRAETLPSPFILIDDQKWYNTGDLGILHDDGCLEIAGRLKRFVKVGGEMISLTAIETLLMEAAPQQGWYQGQEGPILAVCAKEDHGRPEFYLFTRFAVTPTEATKVLREQGGSSLVKISKVFQLPEIPVSGTGKVAHRALEKEYLDF